MGFDDDHSTNAEEEVGRLRDERDTLKEKLVEANSSITTLEATVKKMEEIMTAEVEKMEAEKTLFRIELQTALMNRTAEADTAGRGDTADVPVTVLAADMDYVPERSKAKKTIKAESTHSEVLDTEPSLAPGTGRLGVGELRSQVRPEGPQDKIHSIKECDDGVSSEAVSTKEATSSLREENRMLQVTLRSTMQTIDALQEAVRTLEEEACESKSACAESKLHVCGEHD